jgi:hypothetical protein
MDFPVSGFLDVVFLKIIVDARVQRPEKLQAVILGKRWYCGIHKGILTGQR